MKQVIVCSLLAILLASACASPEPPDKEDWESKTYDVGEFSSISLEGGYKVFLIQGNENSVRVKASDDDVFDYIQIKNYSDELNIDLEPDHFDFDRIILYITFKDLERLKIEGGVKLETKGYLDLNDFDMYVAGGAKIEIEMKAEDVEIVGEGGVLFELDGVARSLDVSISGAGHVDADDLKTKDVNFKIEGVGTGSVYATETLYARIEGVGKIKYLGDPKVSKSIEGLGSVTKD